MKNLLGFSIFFVLISFSVIAQDTIKCNDKYFKDHLLDKLVGNWDLKGTIGNEHVTNNCSCQWILNHQFIELNLTDTLNIPTYTAKVFIGYDCISERYVAHWIDNYGGRYSETLGFGQLKGSSIEFRFEYPNGPFINKFIFDNKNNKWQLNMTTKNSKGDWVLFGNEFLSRKN
ncbi:MAG: DUF1579 family protein [Bacteroidales bacterium]